MQWEHGRGNLSRDNEAGGGDGVLWHLLATAENAWQSDGRVNAKTGIDSDCHNLDATIANKRSGRQHRNLDKANVGTSIRDSIPRCILY